MRNDRINQLKQLLENNKADSFTRYLLALEYRELGETDKCFDLFKEIVETDPSYTAVYYHLGKLYEDMGRRDEAEETYIMGTQMVQDKTSREYKELVGALEQLRC